MVSNLPVEVLFEFPSSCKRPSSSLQEGCVFPAPSPPSSRAEALSIEVLSSRPCLCRGWDGIDVSAWLLCEDGAGRLDVGMGGLGMEYSFCSVEILEEGFYLFKTSYCGASFMNLNASVLQLMISSLWMPPARHRCGPLSLQKSDGSAEK